MQELSFKGIYLRNFRNFKEITIALDPKINVFSGLNAQGKTNLLEAIGLISTGRSFRTQHLNELIRDDASFFFIEASIIRDGISQTVRISYDGKTKRVECNGSNYPSFQALLGLMPSIIFAPPDIDLISGAPAARRRFFNLHLAQSDPLYFHHMIRFWRALKQRNALLRTHREDGIDSFEHEMAISAAYLVEKRELLLNEINADLQKSCQTLSCETIQVKYEPSHLAQLQKSRPKELIFGMTLSGPHRDDFSISINQKPASLFASEGQKRTAIAALRLSEWMRLQRQIGASPIFGIDDFELHLDRERQQLFKNALQNLGQVFITTPIEKPSFENAKILPISAGMIHQ